MASGKPDNGVFMNLSTKIFSAFVLTAMTSIAFPAHTTFAAEQQSTGNILTWNEVLASIPYNFGKGGSCRRENSPVMNIEWAVPYRGIEGTLFSPLPSINTYATPGAAALAACREALSGSCPPRESFIINVETWLIHPHQNEQVEYLQEGGPANEWQFTYVCQTGPEASGGGTVRPGKNLGTAHISSHEYR
jgi:hypothetical protein